MTYQFLEEWVLHTSRMFGIVSGKFKLTLDYNSYHILLGDIRDTILSKSNNAPYSQLTSLNTKFGNICIVVKMTSELYQKLELKK